MKTLTEAPVVLTFSRMQFPAFIHLSAYESGHALALVATSANDGEPLATLSVNLPEEPLSNENCFWCKDYSENAGIGDQLETLEIAKRTGRRTQSGFVTIDEFELCEPYREAAQAILSQLASN